MNRIVHPTAAVVGNLLVPPSKSFSQRALALAYLAEGTSYLSNIGTSKDELVAIDILTQSGARLSRDHQALIVDIGGPEPNSLRIECGESGLAARLFTPIFASKPFETKIGASGSLLQRPMTTFSSIFEQLKVRYFSEGGMFPITLQGPFQLPHSITVDGAQSSQYVTGLLYAILGCERQHPITLTIENPTSIPYIWLSLEVLSAFGVNLKWESGKIIIPATAKIRPSTIAIEADWSSASFWVVAAAISGKVTLEGLNLQSSQADKAILSVVEQYGALVSVTGTQITVASKGSRAFVFDANNCPDLFPPLVALAATASGISEIRGVGRLYHKESNRALTLQSEFAKLGVNIELEDDLMRIHGVAQLKGNVVKSHGDHRIAMSCALAILMSKEPILIEGAEAVNKSYPDFFKHLSLFGVNSYEVE